MSAYCEVVFPGPARDAYSYRAGPFAGRLAPGQRVKAPFGPRLAVGFVVGTGHAPAFRGSGNIRTLAALVDPAPLLTPSLVALARWMADYYWAGLGTCLNAALSAASAPPARPVPDDEPFDREDPPPENVALTPGQQDILAALQAQLAGTDRRPALLLGVAASGKTEIYLRLAAAVAADGRQALFLVPEIALTAQMAAWAQARFGPRAAVLHSRLARGEHYRLLHRARRGALDLVIGTRSALFTPLARPGLIIVDEEFDRSFKETRAPRYHARETALARGALEQALVVLGGATPSLEAWQRAQSGEMRLFRLEEKVFGTAPPRVHLVDRRAAGGPGRRREAPVSDGLRRLIEARLLRREQVVILVDRRTRAVGLACRRCGHRMRCDHCRVNLAYQKSAGRLACPYCSRSGPPPPACPGCGSRSLGPKSTGLKAVAQELQRLFPGHAVITAAGAEATDPLADFRGGRGEILVGTRLVAKGHHFPAVTLAAVIGADRALNQPDFRAAEQTFQVLLQLAGRAGRCLPGAEVLIETRHPEHYAFTSVAAFNPEQFYTQELAFRREAGYPPFGQLANIVFSGRREEPLAAKTATWGQRLAAAADSGGGRVELLGPAPCWQAKRRGLHRRHIILKAARAGEITALLAALPGLATAPGIAVDIDPVDLL